MRIDSSKFYVRNAVQDVKIKMACEGLEWESAEDDITEVAGLIVRASPKIIFSFGSFSYEFCRRALSLSPKRKYGEWGAIRLGKNFVDGINAFDVNKTNLLPLLHRSISGGRFLESHRDFCNDISANYFEFTSKRVSDVLLKYRRSLDIWI